jgi:hypothetical protein
MDTVQKHNSFNTNTPSSESYRNYSLLSNLLHLRVTLSISGPHILPSTLFSDILTLCFYDIDGKEKQPEDGDSKVLWSVGILHHYYTVSQPEDGGSKALRNVGILPHHYMVPQPEDPYLNIHCHENHKLRIDCTVLKCCIPLVKGAHFRPSWWRDAEGVQWTCHATERGVTFGCHWTDVNTVPEQADV